MRLQALALGVFIGAGACVPAVAFAQTMPAIGAKREWTVGARVAGYYDNNVPRSNKDFPQRRPLSREDFVVTPSLTVAVVQPFGRQSLFLNGDAGYTFYRRNSELDRRRATMTGGVASILGPCRQITYGTYDAGQSDLNQLDATTSSNLRETVTVSAGLQCARPLGPGASIMVQRADTKNSARVLRESDATTESAFASISYSRPSLGTFNVGAAYTNTEFPNRINPGRPVGDGFFSQVYNVGYSRAFSSRLSVNGSVGISHVKREFAPPGVSQTFNSTAYNADIVYGLGQRIDFEVRASRAVSPSQQVGKAYDLRTSAEALVRFDPSSRLSFSTGYSWQEVDSNVDTAAALLVVTNSKVDAIFGSVTFKPNNILSLTLDARYEEREANLPEFTYSATRVGVRAQANF